MRFIEEVFFRMEQFLDLILLKFIIIIKVKLFYLWWWTISPNIENSTFIYGKWKIRDGWGLLVFFIG